MAGPTAGRFGGLCLLRKCGSPGDPTDTRNRPGAGGERPTVSVGASGAGESRQPAIASRALRGAHSGARLCALGLGSAALDSFAPKFGWICHALRLELNIGGHLPRCANANMAGSSRASHECQVQTLDRPPRTPLEHACHLYTCKTFTSQSAPSCVRVQIALETPNAPKLPMFGKKVTTHTMFRVT